MKIPEGKDIRAARENSGLTQSELAQMAGVSQPLITRIESDDVDPTIDTLYSIVSALNDSTPELDEGQITMLMPSVLKKHRQRAGYTQGELAEAAGVSQPLISRIERQTVNPRSSTLRSLFDQFDSATTSSEVDSKNSPSQSDSVLEEIEKEFEKLRDM